MGFLVLTPSGEVVLSKHVRLDERMLAEAGGNTSCDVGTGPSTLCMMTLKKRMMPLQRVPLRRRSAVSRRCLAIFFAARRLLFATRLTISSFAARRTLPRPPLLEPVDEVQATHEDGELTRKSITLMHNPLRTAELTLRFSLFARLSRSLSRPQFCFRSRLHRQRRAVYTCGP